MSATIRYRLVGCCNGAWLSPSNPRGFHPKIVDGDFDGFFEESLTPGLGLWLQGLGGLCDPYIIGQLRGGNTICAYAPAWESPIPAPALREVTDALRRQGLKTVAYGGTVRPRSLPPASRPRLRAAAAKALLAPLLQAGVDIVGYDASGGIRAEGSDALYMAGYTTQHLGETILEPHCPVDADCFPWLSGAFSLASSQWAMWTWGENGPAKPEERAALQAAIDRGEHVPKSPDGRVWVSRFCTGIARNHYAVADLTVDAAVRQAMLLATDYCPVVETLGLDLSGIGA